MGWTDLPTGGFTGIDWARPGATDGFDPYLVWAEADRFAGYGGMPEDGWLPLAIELRSGCSIASLVKAASAAWLQVPEVYLGASIPAGFRFCTARVRREFFRQLQSGGALHALVKRCELGLPAGSQARPLEAQEPQQREPHRDGAAAAAPLTGKVLGLIDDSLALAHANFLDRRGAPRVAAFWRQDGQGVGAVPAGLGYGHELRAADIQRAMERNTHGGSCDEGGVYIDLGLSTLGSKSPGGRVRFHALDTDSSHGTLVLDLAAGPRALPATVANLPPGFDAPPSWKPADDQASRCPVVAVQLDCDTVRDTSGGSMNVGILDGLAYILSRCGPRAELTVNISFGTLAGPHDGSSLLEAAMDQLVELHGERLKIVLAAGNGYQSRTHANVPLKAGSARQPPWLAQATLDWVVLPDDQTQSFLELWLPAGGEGVTLEITPPGQPASPLLRWGESRMWLLPGQALPACAVIYPARVATGENGTCALLALAPTFSFEDGAVTAPSGRWRVKLACASGEAVVDAYIERDDIVGGTRGAGRQSHFEDALYDPGAEVDDPRNPTLIRRSGSFNSIATGSKTVSVGATRMTSVASAPSTPDGKWALYSPRRPDPDASRPERSGVVKMPRDAGFGDENPILEGVTGAGTRSGAVVRLTGTSAAAPQVTRRIL